jgi:hypothetical protein
MSVVPSVAECEPEVRFALIRSPGPGDEDILYFNLNDIKISILQIYMEIIAAPSVPHFPSQILI